MKGMFGVLSLLVALAIVGVLVKKQLSAANGVAVAGSPGGASGLSVQRRAAQVQEQIRSGAASALQEGADRIERADEH